MNTPDERKAPRAKRHAGPSSRAGIKKPVAKKDSPSQGRTFPASFKALDCKTGHGVSAVRLIGITPADHPLTQLEWVSVIRKGVPSAAVEALTGYLLLSQADLSVALDIPERTLARRKNEGILNRDESAKMVRTARVLERAEEVFEEAGAARVWLKSANTSLSGETPLSLLDTEVGAEIVLDTLGRIEHGVFA